MITIGGFINNILQQITILQVTVSRDSSSSDYSLDAGALVLADQGT